MAEISTYLSVIILFVIIILASAIRILREYERGFRRLDSSVPSPRFAIARRVAPPEPVLEWSIL